MAAFEKLGLCSELTGAVSEMGWLLPTPVQDEAVPYILNGADVMVAAETGSGKTGAFALPALQVVYEELRENARSSTKKKTAREVPEFKLTAEHCDSQIKILDSEGRKAKSFGNWTGGRTSIGLVGGKYYFEVTCISNGNIRVGWATGGSTYNLGTDTKSYGYGFTGKKSFGRSFDAYPEDGLQTFTGGDIIGCFIDFTESTVAFSVNGEYLGVAFEIMDSFKTGMYPAWCGKKKGEVDFNFGPNFEYTPGSGYRGLHEVSRDHTTAQFESSGGRVGAGGCPYCIILEPTFDLAMQVHQELDRFSVFLTEPHVLTALVAGGRDRRQMMKEATQAHVIVATIGSFVGAVKKNEIKLNRCKFFIVDEADQMCGRGGDLDNVKALWTRCPREVQTCLFSATLHSQEITEVGDFLCKNPTWVDLKGRDYVPDTVNHSIIIINPEEQQEWKQRYNGLQTDEVHAHDVQINQRNVTSELLSEAVKRSKLLALKEVIDAFEMDQAIIFCRTNVDCENCYRWLVALGGNREYRVGAGGKENPYSCVELRGGLQKQQRQQNLAAFKQGHVRFLISTDAGARGLDVQGLPFVINVTLPDKPENYLHRIGRVGRAEKKGLAVSLVSCVKEKVWYHANCGKDRGKTCRNTNLLDRGGCCIWYDEADLMKQIEERVGASLPELKRRALVKGRVASLVKSLDDEDPLMLAAKAAVESKENVVQELQQMEYDCQNFFLSMPRRWEREFTKRRRQTAI